MSETVRMKYRMTPTALTDEEVRMTYAVIPNRISDEEEDDEDESLAGNPLLPDYIQYQYKDYQYTRREDIPTTSRALHCPSSTIPPVSGCIQKEMLDQSTDADIGDDWIYDQTRYTTNNSTLWTLYDSYRGVSYSRDIPIRQADIECHSNMPSFHNSDNMQPDNDCESFDDYGININTQYNHLQKLLLSTAQPGWRLCYQDFSPQITMDDVGQIICVQTFQDLIQEANSWLRQNPQLCSKSCETIKWITSDPLRLGDTESVVLDKNLCSKPSVQGTSFLSHHWRETFHVIGLRLWVVPSKTWLSKQTVFQSKCDCCNGCKCDTSDNMTNCTEACNRGTRNRGGDSCKAEINTEAIGYKDYKSKPNACLEEFVAYINGKLKKQPLQGEITSMHCMYITSPSSENRLLEQLVWREHQCDSTNQQMSLRVFYKHCGITPAVHTIGIHDICPESSQSMWDSFSVLMKRATHWIRKDTSVYVTNLQSLYIDRKLADDSAQISSDQCCQSNRDFQLQQCFQVLRLYYIQRPTRQVTQSATSTERSQANTKTLPTKCSNKKSGHHCQSGMTNRANDGKPNSKCDATQDVQDNTQHVINCMTFTPVQTTLGPNTEADFERMKQTMNRISAWLELAGANIRSAETFVTPIICQSPNHTLPEMTHWMPLSHDETTTAKHKQKYLMHIRVYLEGDFSDPDPLLLPPLPYSLTVALQSSIQEREYKKYYKQKKSRQKRRKITVLVFICILTVSVGVILLDQLFDIFGRFS